MHVPTDDEKTPFLVCNVKEFVPEDDANPPVYFWKTGNITSSARTSMDIWMTPQDLRFCRAEQLSF